MTPLISIRLAAATSPMSGIASGWVWRSCVREPDKSAGPSPPSLFDSNPSDPIAPYLETEAYDPPQARLTQSSDGRIIGATSESRSLKDNTPPKAAKTKNRFARSYKQPCTK